MTTYEKNVHDTAEKMAEIVSGGLNRAQHIWAIGETSYNHIISQYIPLAEYAVAMKAEGFDEGWNECLGRFDKKGDWTKEEIKQSLGLTNPEEKK